ncbi:FmdE family protein [Desulfurella sp.]|uniref:FmdE family protein n=1 Tax=Desulfurella sp. TaxID=1962857 RepID=UPI003D0E7701
MFETYKELVESINVSDTEKESLYAALATHGHVCGGMALGFACGLFAMKALDISKERDLGTRIIANSGYNHIASCFVDGLQFSTGCTFGKRLIEKNPIGKWSFLIMHIKTQKALKVKVKPEIIKSALGSSYVKDYRSKGINASSIPTSVSYALFRKVFELYNNNLLIDAQGPFDYPSKEEAITFNYEICQVCSDAVAQNYIKIEDGKKVCIECAHFVR